MKKNTDKAILLAIGQNIKKVRTEKKISQTELALLVQSQKASMSRIEAGQANIKVFSLYRIASSLNVTIPELLQNVQSGAPVLNQEFSDLRQKFARYSNRVFDLNMQYKGLMAELSLQTDYLKRRELLLKAREILEATEKINQKTSDIIRRLGK